MKALQKPTFVYFVRPLRQEGPIKIGCSNSPVVRLGTLMTWAPVPLEIVTTIPGDRKLERRIHGVFADLHSHHEWFRAAPHLVEFVAELAAGAPIGELIDLSAPILQFRPKSRRNFSPDRRMYLSYSARMRWAYKRLAGKSSPHDVDAILSRWNGVSYRAIAGVSPTVAELSRLEEVLCRPDRHAVDSQQKWSRSAPPAPATSVAAE